MIVPSQIQNDLGWKYTNMNKKYMQIYAQNLRLFIKY